MPYVRLRSSDGPRQLIDVREQQIWGQPSEAVAHAACSNADGLASRALSPSLRPVQAPVRALVTFIAIDMLAPGSAPPSCCRRGWCREQAHEPNLDLSSEPDPEGLDTHHRGAVDLVRSFHDRMGRGVDLAASVLANAIAIVATLIALAAQARLLLRLRSAKPEGSQTVFARRFGLGSVFIATGATLFDAAPALIGS